MTTPETATPTIERPDGAPVATPAKPTEPETGFHFYQGKEVAVQLVHEYIRGRDKEGRDIGTKVLVGKLAVTHGIAPGSYLFLLEAPQEDGTMHYISIYPEDVRHLTHEVASRIVAP